MSWRALLIGCLLALPALAQEAPLAELGWLEGTWEGEARWRGREGAQACVAVYTAPKGGEVHSSSKTLDDAGRVVAFEFERFHLDAQGRVALTPFPGGQQAVTFTRSRQGPRLAEFTHPTNDWPRLLRYAREGETLTIVAAGGPDQPVLEVTLRLRP